MSDCNITSNVNISQDDNISQNNSKDDNINIFIGKWKLHKMNNFNSFLKFIKLNVFISQLIKKIPVSLLIKDYNDGSYQKKITSPFYSVDEKILLDNEYRDYDQFTKKYKMEDNMIICQAKINKYKIKWKEVIYLKKNILYVDFMWTDKKGINQFARHIFKK